MWSHFSEFKIYREHVVLEKLRYEILKKNNSPFIKKVLKEHIIFLYPKIISFSFQKYSEKLTNYNELYGAYTDSLKKSPKDFNSNEKEFFLAEDWNTFFCVLSEVIKEQDLTLFIICDLRYLNLFDNELILSFIYNFNDMNSIGSLLLPEDINDNVKNEFETDFKINKINIFYSIAKLIEYIEELSHQNEYSYEVVIKGKISIKALEENLPNLADEHAALNKYLFVKILFISSSNINIFSLAILNHFFHDIWEKKGILFTLRFDDNSNGVLKKICDLRTYEVSRLFFVEKYQPPIGARSTSRILGGYLYDKNDRRDTKLLFRFDEFLFKIRTMFSGYIEEFVKINYDSSGTSYETQQIDRARFVLIKDIVSELIDNVTLHSEGVGYFAAEISMYHLYLFIGDCGIGLKNGILKNYNLFDEIDTDEKALSELFRLNQFNRKRKNVIDINLNAGHGLRRCLNNIFALDGKFCVRTDDLIAFFMNPINRSDIPSKIIKSNFYIKGTQYMIVIPLFRISQKSIPQTYEDFLNLEE